MVDDSMFRTLPVWGAGTSTGPGPGLQGPDYSEQRPPQPGEGMELLPDFPGSDAEIAEENRQLVRRGETPANDQRLPPHLVLFKTLVYAAGVNVVDLGRPDQGMRWVVRQLSILPGTTITDAGMTGVFAHFYIGALPPVGGVPALSDWAWDLAPIGATVFTASATFTSNILQVQGQQHLVALLTGGTNGFTYLPQARVEQIPDHVVPLVSGV